MSRRTLSAALSFAAVVATAAGAFAGAPGAHAASLENCVPAGARYLYGATPEYPRLHLYQYRYGPITECYDGEKTEVELGGWQSQPRSTKQAGIATDVFAFGGDCIALRSVTYTGETRQPSTIDVINLRSKTTRRIDEGTSTFKWDSAGGGWLNDSVRGLTFGPDCSSSWSAPNPDGSTAPEVKTAPAPTDSIPAFKGLRPKLKRAPSLVRDTRGRLSLKLAFDRKPRGATIVFGGRVKNVTNVALAAKLSLPAGSNAPVRKNRLYPVTITACNDGCTTRTYRVKLK